MSVAFELNAEPRTALGTSASRRLRRQGRLPAILYGGDQPPEELSLDHQQVLRQMANEAFYSHVLNIQIGSRTEQAIIRDLHRHPYKPTLLHMDLLRVTADHKLRAHVPLHFIHEDSARGVKLQSGTVSRLRIEVEVSCLPKDLPEYIEVDLIDLEVGESIHLSELKLPEGVEIVDLMHGAENDTAVASIHGKRAETDDGEGGEGTDGASPA
ncbi:MAG: 50S ribosomal protein L25/general stress protein Ctc [Gammaproteobacteria bacterium]|nr:50S ribosomal protein L25/general stress protein Ctc [Gammaproteobacteria bacterium]MCP5424221.1 50S ribosomal protein L25/general stress protein Ctc [Gammaproteobacteria bacterium]